MSALQNLSTEEIQQLAKQWREQALRGAKEARGLAHEYEAEVRRRLGSSASTTARNLDLRPLDQREQRAATRPWWKVW